MFSGLYAGKKVIITGNTGFKGSWLTCWLLSLGAEIVGVSKDIPSEPSMFNELSLGTKIRNYNVDIRDASALSEIFLSEKPDFLFHLAAQAIVSVSYSNPIETITSNAVGTMNIMEVLKKADWPLIAVLITSDKSYDNVEWVWGYKENDAIGGKDVYSGSKAAAEVIIKSYYHSFFKKSDVPVRLGIGRAGNVIGGGDWAKDRIIVDIVKAWSEERSVEIRSPDATRPWQHVLEPLSGYLTLGQNLSTNPELDGEAFNFGPRAEQNRTVVDLLVKMSESWDAELPANPYVIVDEIPFDEAGLLKLNCDKALFELKWDATYDYRETVAATASWYAVNLKGETNMFDFTMDQIKLYSDQAAKRGAIWCR
ncbi:MAG: CDP-glucose 4,6-dehydratase [Legionellales bacterium]|nr:CDP-glucose 4,6-dehydratase [Legionellales bacterium]